MASCSTWEGKIFVLIKDHEKRETFMRSLFGFFVIFAVVGYGYFGLSLWLF